MPLSSSSVSPLHAAVIALASVTACATSTPPETAREGPTYRVHDLTPTFWRYWSHAERRSEAEQVNLLEAEVIRAHPDVYTAHVIGLDPDKPFSEELRVRWPKFMAFAGPQLPLAQTLSESIGRDLPQYDARFREAFPDFSYDGDVYFLMSLGGFDGGLRTVNGRMALMFGVDIIARVYGADADPASFFHHELFHLYHQQFPDPDLEGTLARALWVEGLATLVADRLNPGTPQSVLLGLPLNTPTRVRADLPALAGELRARLDSRSSQDYERYFLGSAEDASPPSRAGYTIGYLVAKDVAGTRSLSELARLRGPALRAEIEGALERFTSTR